MDFLGTEFVNAAGDKLDASAVTGYKLVMIVFSASWWGGCTPFKASLKNFYNEWNKDGAQNIQVVIVSGDQNQDGFNSTMNDMPFVALPFGANKAAIEAKIPCTGYPTPGVVNGSTGAVIVADAFGKVDQANYDQWMSNVWDTCWPVMSWQIHTLNTDRRQDFCFAEFLACGAIHINEFTRWNLTRHLVNEYK